MEVKDMQKRRLGIVLLLMVFLAACSARGTAGNPEGSLIVVPDKKQLAAISVDRAGSNFRYWNKGAPSYQQLTAYVKDVTDRNSPHFIPVKDRIAVFDLDGTLVCETTPSYFEWMLYLKRALDDPSYTPSAKEKAYAQLLKGGSYHIGIPNPVQGTGLEGSPYGKDVAAPKSLPKGMDKGEAEAQEAVFAGMTLPEYEKYVRSFLRTPAEGMKNLARGDAFYLPMVEVISYLRANDFKIFIVTGSDRQAVRVIVDGVLPIEPENVIGTDCWFLASHQGNHDGLDYVYTKDDRLVRGGFVLKNVKMNKVHNIAREIGKQPVLAFGNSSGDASMLNYTLTNNRYKALSFALLCDDTERELGNQGKADKMRASCQKNGWIPISMKQDFATIYGSGVTRADR